MCGFRVSIGVVLILLMCCIVCGLFMEMMVSFIFLMGYSLKLFFSCGVRFVVLNGRVVCLNIGVFMFIVMWLLFCSVSSRWWFIVLMWIWCLFVRLVLVI